MMTNNSIFYAAIMLLAGLGIPTMAALNAGLGAKLQSPAVASVILLLSGSVIALAYLLASQGLPRTLFVASTPGYFYLGGFLLAFYILSITWIAPRFGVANAIAFVLLGQLIAMTLIDHFGWFSAIQMSVSPQRVTGLVLMVAGVFLVLKRS